MDATSCNADLSVKRHLAPQMKLKMDEAETTKRGQVPSTHKSLEGTIEEMLLPSLATSPSSRLRMSSSQATRLEAIPDKGAGEEPTRLFGPLESLGGATEEAANAPAKPPRSGGHKSASPKPDVDDDLGWPP